MILSPAKLNLSLKVNDLLDNGYHSISSYVFFLDLFDKLFIRTSSQNAVEVGGKFKNELIRNGGDSIIKKSLSVCQRYSHFNKKLHVKLEKNIPVSAGLGGGSSNGAAIIRYYLSNKKSELKTVDEAIKLSSFIGSDVPACIYSKPLLMEGIGEKIKLIEFNYGLNLGVVLINPNIQLSTKRVFNSLVLNKHSGRKKSILKVRTFCDIDNICKLGNDLEKPAIKIVPEILNVLAIFKSSQACFSYGMSGSGATCFGIFHSKKDAKDFKRSIERINKFQNYWVWSGGFLKKKEI